MKLLGIWVAVVIAAGCTGPQSGPPRGPKAATPSASCQLQTIMNPHAFASRQLIIEIKARVQECGEQSRSQLRYAIGQWHHEAINGGPHEARALQKLLTTTDLLYKVYVEVYANAQDIDDVQRKHGNLLTGWAARVDDPKLALTLWSKTAQVYDGLLRKTNNKLAKREAAAAGMKPWRLLAGALDRQRADDNTDEAATNDVGPTALSAQEATLVAIGQRFLSTMPRSRHEDAIAVRYYMGKTYWRHHNYDKAAALLHQVVKLRPDTEYIDDALTALLHALDTTRRFKDIDNVVKRLNNHHRFLLGSRALEEKVRALTGYRAWKAAQFAAEAGDTEACARQYMRLFASNRSSPIAADYLLQAAGCLIQGDRRDDAERVLKMLIAKYPGSPASTAAQGKLDTLGN